MAKKNNANNTNTLPEQEFNFIVSDVRIPRIRNADLVCTDCLYKYDDTNMPCNVSKCEMYEEKPSTVIDGGNCDLYDKGVSE